VGLENLKSIFTEGMKKMNNSDLSTTITSAGSPYSPPELLDKIGKSKFDNLKNKKITDVGSYLETGDFSKIQLPQIGSGFAGNTFNNFTDGSTPLYESVTYDPRTPGSRFTITPNTYKGTRLTKSDLSPGGSTGIGGVFNSGVEYSNSFRSMISPLGYFSSPDGNDIIVGGNLVNNAGGYPTKTSAMETFIAARGLRPTTYEQNFNTETSAIVKNEIPSFNGLTIGQNHLGTIGIDGSNLMTTPTSVDKLGTRSWEELYNAGHTAKTDMGYHYSAYVDKGNLNIRHTNNINSPDRGDEPYIISNIGNRRHRSSSRFRPLRRGKTDAKRLLKYHKSRAGRRSFLEQMLFSNRNRIPVVTDNVKGKKMLVRVPQRFENDYNPLANVLYQRLRFAGEAYGPIKIRRSGKSVTDDRYTGLLNPFLVWKTGTQLNTISMEIGGKFVPPVTKAESEVKKDGDKSSVSWSWAQREFSRSTPGKDTGFRDRWGDVLTLLPLVTHESDITKAEKVRRVPTLDEDNNIVHTTGKDKVVKTDYIGKSGLPFYFKDLRDDTYVVFRAYIDGINENITPTWTPTSYVGRSEPVYNYQQTERDLSFNLKMYAQNREELDALYKKLNRLTSMCYPQYAPDKNVTTDQGLGDGSEIPAIRMKPPLVRFRMGDMFGGNGGDVNMMLGFIKSISYTVPDEGVWETELHSQKPKLIMAAIQFQVIHEHVPNYMSQFYGKTLPDGKVKENNLMGPHNVNAGGFADEVPSK